LTGVSGIEGFASPALKSIPAPPSPRKSNGRAGAPGQPDCTEGFKLGVSISARSSPIDDVRFNMAGRRGRLFVGFIALGGGTRLRFGASSSPIATPESRGLNLRETVEVAGANASASGLTSSKMGGSAGEKAETGGVRPAVDSDESDEFDARSGSAPRPGLGVSDNARPDF
jgi:hypothetical protein